MSLPLSILAFHQRSVPSPSLPQAHQSSRAKSRGEGGPPKVGGGHGAPSPTKHSVTQHGGLHPPHRSCAWQCGREAIKESFQMN